MRPAQKAPENTEIMLNSLERDINFNEAGAKSAGKHNLYDDMHGKSRLLQ